MKFLYVTDTHLTAKGPSSRTDSYVGAIMEKFEELKQVIIDEDIEAVFHGGDLFDKPVVSLQLTGMIAQFIKSTGVPWYVVPGNHDLFGYNIKSLPQTSLGLLNQAGVISILYRGSGPVEFTAPSGDIISFEGQEYHMDIDHRQPEMDYFVTSDAHTKVLIPHSMLLDKEYFPEVPYTNTVNLKDRTEAHIILVGHYHDGYSPQMITHSDGSVTHVYNPGSQTRDEGSKGNLTRRPKYVIVDYKDKLTWSFNPYEFQCAKLGQDIFDRSHITQKAAKDKYLQSFEQKLSDVKLDAVDVRDVLDKMIVKDTTIDAEIADAARNRLVEAEQAIDDVAKQMTGYVEKPDNISIDRIEIKGFQSHEDSTVSLTGGLNAIIGPSDSGKSAIIRALRFALYNEPKGSEFIRQGASGCEVSVHFSDGSSIRRARTQSSAGTYEIVDSSGEKTSLKGFSNNVPVDVPNTHQMPHIQLTKDLETSLNVGYQLDAPFLIGESPGTRAAIIGRLTGVNLVDTAVREIGKDILGNTRDIKTYAAQIEETETKIQSFNHLPELKKTIDAASKTMAEMDLWERMRQEYLSLENELSEITTAENDIQAEIQKLDGFKELAPLVSQLEGQMNALNGFQSLQTLLQSTDTGITAMKEQLQNIIDLSFVDKLEQNITECNGLKALQSDILTVTNELDSIKDDLYWLPSPNIVLDIGVWEGVLKDLRESEQLQSELQLNRLEINNLRKEIRLAYLTEGKALEEHTKLLEENGTCPTCNQIIQRGLAHEHIQN